MSVERVARIERALASMWTRQAAWMPGGRSDEVHGGVLVMTDVLEDGLGGALFLTGDDGWTAVEQARDVAFGRGRDLAIDVTIGRHPALTGRLEAAGFRRVVERNVMAAVPPLVRPVRMPSRTMTGTDVGAVRRLQCAAFDMAPSSAEALVPDDIAVMTGSLVAVVEEADRLVATATAHLDAGTVGIFGVAADPGDGGRGFGTAATIAASELGDTDLVWLQAGDDVAGFYERLGFVTVDRSEVWIGGHV